jgi:hypothetical protein
MPVSAKDAGDSLQDCDKRLIILTFSQETLYPSQYVRHTSV